MMYTVESGVIVPNTFPARPAMFTTENNHSFSYRPKDFCSALCSVIELSVYIQSSKKALSLMLRQLMLFFALKYY